jgi:Ca2+-binding RTX toxin-like protein
LVNVAEPTGPALLREGGASMKRIMLLTALAAMMAAAMALSGVAQAKSPIGNKADAKCLAEANKTLQPGFNYADYNIVGGTEGNDDIEDFQPTAGPDVFCGFGGDDSIFAVTPGDIFLGGEGTDRVEDNSGTFYGGAGDDNVLVNRGGTFNGGEGTDTVSDNRGTIINVEQGDV